jgi:hypothetical protein
MVTTRAGYAKKLLGAQLDDGDGDNHVIGHGILAGKYLAEYRDSLK